ncbi:MAG: polysaccharide deacetylase family protein [Candidatus Hodarchaeota archaeon]
MSPKHVYLTIDDAPSSDTARKVDYLSSRGIPVLWFCRGEFLEKEMEKAIYIIEKGFVIGNHSYNHPYFSALTLEQCIDQIDRTDELINSVYTEAGIKRPANIFRFPFGDKGDDKDKDNRLPEERANHVKDIQDYLRRRGYKQPGFEGITYDWYVKAELEKGADVFWTYDAMDWKIRGNSLEKVLALMDEDDPVNCLGLNHAGSADIIVMHDFNRTKDWFVPMIEKFLEKGLKFVLPGFT